jgi:hypothetical protein
LPLLAEINQTFEMEQWAVVAIQCYAAFNGKAFIELSTFFLADISPSSS